MPLANGALKEGSLVRLAGPSMQSERGHYVVTRQDEDRKTVLRLVERLVAVARQARRAFDKPLVSSLDA